jgi:hypothetical protein
MSAAEFDPISNLRLMAAAGVVFSPLSNDKE